MIRTIENWQEAAAVRLFRKSLGFSLLRFRGGLNLIHRRGTRDWDVIHEILYAGGYGKALSYLCGAEGGVVLDLGANIGVFSLAAASANTRISVSAFEPGPPNADLFAANIAINPDVGKRIVLSRAAVGGWDSEAKWHFDAQNPGGSALKAGIVGGVTVPVRSLSSVLDTIREPIALLKMDVEGTEYDILENTPHDLWAKIPAIGMELHDGKNVGERDAFLQKLKQLGYEIAPDACSTLFLKRTT
ncbi:MAG: FkbM family methyltransferase [Verrucomicrobiota bacterium]